MSMLKNSLKILAVLPLVFALNACGDGEAEEAGEEIDEMVTDAGNAVEDACEEVKEGMDAKDEDC